METDEYHCIIKEYHAPVPLIKILSMINISWTINQNHMMHIPFPGINLNIIQSALHTYKRNGLLNDQATTKPACYPHIVLCMKALLSYYRRMLCMDEQLGKCRLSWTANVHCVEGLAIDHLRSQCLLLPSRQHLFDFRTGKWCV